MSVTVKHLNADSTFLLTFSPEPNPSPSDLKSSNGAYTVLIDPWLVGSSVVSAPWFAITKRVIPSAIEHLSQIEEPDVVVVSQNKPDHCHRETLMQLRPEGKTVIAAEPGAAKYIASWNYFDPNRVYSLKKYDPRAKFGNRLRLRIPPLSPKGLEGEVDIAFIPAKNYMTGLHNAIGITYQPPTHSRSLAPVSLVDLPKTTKYFHMPLSPATVPPSSPPPPISPLVVRPMSLDLPTWREESLTAIKEQADDFFPRPRLSRSLATASSEFLPALEMPTLHSDSAYQDFERPMTAKSIGESTYIGQESPIIQLPFEFETKPLQYIQAPPTPPHTPSLSNLSSSTFFQRRRSSVPSHQQSLSSASSYPSLSPVIPARPKAISIIYAPHGLPYSDLQSYVETHLVRIPGALPLTVLLHSFDHAQNPWYLGGNIMTGATGGIEIARNLMARCWLSAHDEPKDDRGVSVKQLKIRRQDADEIRKALWEGPEGEWLRKTGWICDVRSLEVGKEMFVGPARDLCVGMEGKRESRLLKFPAPSLAYPPGQAI